MRESLARLVHLSQVERLALTSLLDKLEQEFTPCVLQVVLYGSSARGDRGADSDVDLLILTRHDDWREHEPIRFLAARLSNEFDVFLSLRVMGLSRFRSMSKMQPLFYKNIHRDGLELLRLGNRPGMARLKHPVAAQAA